MWPFRTRTQPTPTDLIVRLEAVERARKHLETEWLEMYEKFQRLYAKLAQRARREAREAEEEVPEQPTEQITNPLALELLRGKAR